MGCHCGKANSPPHPVNKVVKLPGKPQPTLETNPSPPDTDRLLLDRLDMSKFIPERKGELLLDRYKLKEVVGEGIHGIVQKVFDCTTKQLRAMKIIRKSLYVASDSSEIEVLKRLDHPNILKLFEFYQDENNYYLITEYCSGGELFDKLEEYKNFSEAEAADIMKQVLSAVTYCHRNRVIHRDLKPENILFDSGKDGISAVIKVIDFGAAMVFRPNERLIEPLGTPFYVAPEVLKKSYGKECDIWSCGIIMYILLCGYPPFYGKTNNEIYKRILSGSFTFKGHEWKYISKEAKSLISQMLTYNPNNRITASQALKHPWLSANVRPYRITKSMSSALANLKSFNAAMAYMANNLQSKEENEKLARVFRELDKNGDGLLQKEELIEGYVKLGVERPLAEKLVEPIMEKIDVNKNGTIDYSEFLMANVNRDDTISFDKLKEAFNIFDKDGDGKITLAELNEVLGHSSNDSDMSEIIKMADQNGDGKISFSEFKNMMVRMYKEWY